jgi:hypothetical protein
MKRNYFLRIKFVTLLAWLITLLILLIAIPLCVIAEQDDCPAYQHKENGRCVDNPGIIHRPIDYKPRPTEQCWIECLCYEGQYPATSGGCSPCSTVGIVCQ